ncbi:MAG TPA: hypothetical protein VII73_12170 [Caulobacteraceae bacterium]
MPQEFFFAPRPPPSRMLLVARAALSVLVWSLLIGAALLAGALLIQCR